MKAGRSEQLICNTQIDNQIDWRKQHYGLLYESYSQTKYWKTYQEIVADIYNREWTNLADITTYFIIKISNILEYKTKIIRSSEIKIKGDRDERLILICKELGADEYISPQGSLNYLNHNLFEQEKINVKYINYIFSVYSQAYGLFSPYVSIIDLFCNTGTEAINHIVSETIEWRDVLTGFKFTKWL